jgi:hypothetical protein
MTEPNDDPRVPAEAAQAARPSPAEASGISPPTAGEGARAAIDDPAAVPPGDVPAPGQAESSVEKQDDSPAGAPAESSAPPPVDLPRPFWRAFGHALVHLLAMGSLIFVLVGLAPRIERICDQMGYDDRSALTNFVFDAGYFVRKSWYLTPLLLLFDLGVLLFLRRALNPALARNYSTIVVGIALCLLILFGFGLIKPLAELYKPQY